MYKKIKQKTKTTKSTSDGINVGDFVAVHSTGKRQHAIYCKVIEVGERQLTIRLHKGQEMKVARSKCKFWKSGNERKFPHRR